MWSKLARAWACLVLEGKDARVGPLRAQLLRQPLAVLRLHAAGPPVRPMQTWQRLDQAGHGRAQRTLQGEAEAPELQFSFSRLKCATSRSIALRAGMKRSICAPRGGC